MMQIPNLPNNVQLPQQPNYNAVKIDIHNPMVNVPAQNAAVNPAPQYETPTAPIYEYPQAQTQPYYMPPVITTPEVSATPQQSVAKEVPINPTVVPPAPVVTEQAPKAEEKKSEPAPADNVKSDAAADNKSVDVVKPQEVKPQIDLNAFLAKLTNPDYDVQVSGMENIVDMVDNNPEQASDLLDTKLMEALNNIITADTSKLESTTPEIEAKRAEISARTDLDKDAKQAELNKTLTPQEKAERNKSYAIFTSAILQKLYGEEAKKMYNATVPLTEMPGAVPIVEQLKGNPNATVRTSAVEALSYIQNPSYKKDLNTIFTIAQKDQDEGVREAATIALEKLSKLPDEEVQQAA